MLENYADQREVVLLFSLLFFTLLQRARRSRVIFLLALVDVEVDSPVEESLSGLSVKISVSHMYLGLILSRHPKKESSSSKNSKDSCPLPVALLLSLIFLYLSTRLFHFSFSCVNVFSLSIPLSWQLSLNACRIVCHMAFFL